MRLQQGRFSRESGKPSHALVIGGRLSEIGASRALLLNC